MPKYIGFLSTTDATNGGAVLSGTYLQEASSSNNGRKRKDGLGNLTVDQLKTLKQNWNNLSTRFSILNNSISTASTNANYDINSPYTYFTSLELAVDKSVAPDSTIAIELLKNKLADGDYHILNAADSTYLTYNGNASPEFRPFNNDSIANQTWTITLDATTNRYKIASKADKAIFLNESALTSSSTFNSAYHTFEFYNRSGSDLYNIQNGGSGGTYYWIINDDKVIAGKGSQIMLGQPFILKQAISSAVQTVESTTLNIYSNPVVSVFHMQIPAGSNGGTLGLFSVNGTCLRRMQCHSGLQTIDVQDLPPGVYFAKFYADNTVSVVKIIKEK